MRSTAGPELTKDSHSMAQEPMLSKWEVKKLNVLSSTQISSRTSAVLTQLTSERGASEKPIVVSLEARAKVASKLVSIVEIAKRDLVAKGLRCYQYTGLTSELIEIPREVKKTSKDTMQQGAAELDEDESDDAFETMGAQGGATKHRSVPVMTVYLSTTPVKELKARYGYA